MKNQILNHRYPIYLKGWRKNIVVFLRLYCTQRRWFHWLYHRLFSHRIMDRKCGYAWCEYCNYRQELFLDRLFIVPNIEDPEEERYFFI